ncbi:glycoside hydrolase family 16 protein [Nocardioides marmorisolisilvae]|uniref:Glycoside hydrolase family 16 protein n=1 Tax=Nocardioides marmorisolisilvae TaxID=1542737 RepID=A0A3N0DZB0_9ACTN|nr:glycoside hydrolase family 16 protein [Nocardioides marmorisolisilvae]RNL80927.1 glycoside hydrolase family 16 protein [Nocardioides marmorisolisilvae]
MFRVFLLLVTASVALYIAGGPSVLLEADHSVSNLVSSNRASTSSGVLNRPAIRVLSAPDELELGQPGTAEVQAESPAVPGTTIYLRTAGTYGLGYNQVSKAVLDDNLRASLPITGRAYKGSFNYWATIKATASYQEGDSASWAITIAAAPPPPAPKCGDGPDPVKADGTSWTCSYDDEFDGSTLDRRFWVPQVTATSGATTGTSSMYACATDSPDTIGVANGNLELSLVQLPAPVKCGKGKTSQYAYGQVMHFQTFSQTYGKYEVRAKIPDVSDPGVQETFWLWPNKNSYGQWPASGEIDFAELYSKYADTDKPYIHYYPGSTSAGTNNNVTTAKCPIKVGEFNTYGLEWAPGRLTILLNGDVCMIDDYSSALATLHGKTSPFDKPFFLALTQAMGTTGNVYDTNVVPDKVTTLVDYVRIWK